MQDQQRQVIEYYLKAYNEFDIEKMAMNMHTDLLFENVSNGEINLRTEGLSAFLQQAEAATHYFSERQQKVESWDFQGEKVLVSINYHAVLAADFPNGMKAGDTLTLKGHSTFWFQEGRIVRLLDES